VQSQDLKNIFSRDIKTILKGNKEDTDKLFTALKINFARQLQQNEDVDINLNKETEQLVRKFEADENKSKERTEEGTLSSLEGEPPEDSQVLFMRELGTKRFFDQMKKSGTHDHGEVGPAVAFYTELKAKNCLIIPEYVKI